MEKVLITGTGRCGTTFLIKLFSFLEFNTGYDRSNYEFSIFPNCNSGMERLYDDPYYVLKNPTFIVDIEKIVNDASVIVKRVIIPLRDLTAAAKSRAFYGEKPGGLWNAVDEASQIEFYKNILLNYIEISTKYDISTIFINYEKMIIDKVYLFRKLKNMLDEKNIDFETFSRVYDEASSASKPPPAATMV